MPEQKKQPCPYGKNITEQIMNTNVTDNIVYLSDTVTHV